MKKAVTAIAFAALLTGTATAPAQDGTLNMVDGDPQAGEALSQTCAGCHGPDGNSPQGQWPNIAGQHAGYLYKQLMDFKSGEERANAQMTGMVAGLSKQDMRDLAAYYANQPQKTMGANDKDRVERGQKIYLGGIPDKGVAACVSCHGPHGRGNPGTKYPDVGGQYAQYLITQLEYFRSGERANDRAAMMRSLAGEMSDEEIRAVSEYMAGLN